MVRCLVENQETLPAAQAARLAGERHNLVAGRQIDAERLDCPAVAVLVDVFEHLFADCRGDLVENTQPVRAGVDELARHVEVEADVEGIHAVAPGCR